MLRIASINLNKRFNTRAMRQRLLAWLDAKSVDVLVAQEPWRDRQAGEEFGDYAPLGGNERVHSWAHVGWQSPAMVELGEYWQAVEIGHFHVLNVYLDAYKRETRVLQLRSLTKTIRGGPAKARLLLGDFNIAPRAEDGMVGENVSTFNGETDRGELRALLKSARLRDLGATDRPTRWTIERTRGDKRVSFRCDLALMSRFASHGVAFAQHDEVRVGEKAFTDHSALVVDVPISWPKRDLQLTLFPREVGERARGESNRPVEAQKTAMNRRDPTPISREVVRRLGRPWRVATILDYGCGFGEDVRFYRSLGLSAEGFDPSPRFAWTCAPSGEFDLVTLLFVLNVLASPLLRVEALAAAAKHLSRTGRMIVAARSPAEIEKEAREHSWPVLNDGFWSSEARGTFQRGISEAEIADLASEAGLRLSSEEPLRVSGGTTCVILEHGGSQSSRESLSGGGRA